MLKEVEVHVGDPNLDPFYCELGYPGTQGNCSAYGDFWCWDTDTSFGQQCCGDSADDFYINTANKSCMPNSQGRVVYQTDPDHSKSFCTELSIKVSEGTNSSICNLEGETLCWASSGYIVENGKCCGDDMLESWEYESSKLFSHVLPPGTCYEAAWIERPNYPILYYDVWPLT